jgi:DNA-binding HxlR family transcriptional regulator
MAKPRRYQLLCPIARALDRVGDRWTLLILRDLHAGPARYSDLLTGLDGVASNLLTTRLQQLTADGLVRRREADYGVTLYELTALGRQSGDLLFELARFGGRFPPDEEIQPPGNLRTIAVTLRIACQRVVLPEDDVVAALVVDGEPFTLSARDGVVDVHVGTPEAPDVEVITAYEPMIAVADGDITLEEFRANHVTLKTEDAARAGQFQHLLARAMSLLTSDR